MSYSVSYVSRLQPSYRDIQYPTRKWTIVQVLQFDYTFAPRFFLDLSSEVENS